MLANADAASGPVSFVGTRGGVLLGYEQPLGKSPVSFVADWFSSKNTLGYFTPGISIALPHSGLLNIGYSIGNDVGRTRRRQEPLSVRLLRRDVLVQGR